MSLMTNVLALYSKHNGMSHTNKMIFQQLITASLKCESGPA